MLVYLIFLMVHARQMQIIKIMRDKHRKPQTSSLPRLLMPVPVFLRDGQQPARRWCVNAQVLHVVRQLRGALSSAAARWVSAVVEFPSSWPTSPPVKEVVSPSPPSLTAAMELLNLVSKTELWGRAGALVNKSSARAGKSPWSTGLWQHMCLIARGM